MASSNKTKSINIRIKPLHLDFGKERTLYFPAILTNIKNTYDTKWTEEEVYGRMDPLGSFNSTSRKVSLGFKVVSTTSLEAEDNIGSISALYTYLYPKYKGATNEPSIIQKPPYFEVAFLNLLSDGVMGTGVRGYITNFNVDTPVGSEETSLFFNSDRHLLFTDMNVSFDIRVLHQFSIGWYDDNGAKFRNDDNYPYGYPTLAETEVQAGRDRVAALQEEQQLNSATDLGDLQEYNFEAHQAERERILFGNN
jgi:hypothetical protein